MGQWNMTIIGTGAHHNFKRDETGNILFNKETAEYERTIDYDADVLFKEFVEKLKSMGHTIGHASFTHGAREVRAHGDQWSV